MAPAQIRDYWLDFGLNKNNNLDRVGLLRNEPLPSGLELPGGLGGSTPPLPKLDPPTSVFQKHPGGSKVPGGVGGVESTRGGRLSTPPVHIYQGGLGGPAHKLFCTFKMA